jgi:hypothetical protein
MDGFLLTLFFSSPFTLIGIFSSINFCYTSLMNIRLDDIPLLRSNSLYIDINTI